MRSIMKRPASRRAAAAAGTHDCRTPVNPPARAARVRAAVIVGTLSRNRSVIAFWKLRRGAHRILHPARPTPDLSDRHEAIVETFAQGGLRALAAHANLRSSIPFFPEIVGVHDPTSPDASPIPAPRRGPCTLVAPFGEAGSAQSGTNRRQCTESRLRTPRRRIDAERTYHRMPDVSDVLRHPPEALSE